MKEEKTIQEIAEELQEKNSKLRSLTVYADDERDAVCLQIDKYRHGDNAITEKQAEYIMSFVNCSWHSNSCIRQMNKWCASAVIDALKTYPDTEFFIHK